MVLSRFTSLLLMGAAVVVASAIPSSANIIAQCGASHGHAYFLEGGLVPTGEGGWEEDGISGGGIILMQDGSDYDIVYTDAVGSRSAKADGGRVIVMKHDERVALVLVGYPDAIETYAFSFSGQEVAWTQAKVAGLIDKVASYRATCQ